jgi:predicted ATPase
LRLLVQQMLTESEEQLQDWKKRIQQGVDCFGQIIIDILPELELIIGIFLNLFNYLLSI